MKLRALAVSAAAATAASVALVPAAGAQDVGNMMRMVNDGVHNADCREVRFALEGLNLVDGDTTRGELVADLHGYIGDDAAFRVASAPTINAIGDKALECGIVQPDPFDPAALSSAVMNGDFEQLLITLPALSSQFNVDFDVPFPGLG